MTFSSNDCLVAFRKMEVLKQAQTNNSSPSSAAGGVARNSGACRHLLVIMHVTERHLSWRGRRPARPAGTEIGASRELSAASIACHGIMHHRWLRVARQRDFNLALARRRNMLQPHAAGAIRAAPIARTQRLCPISARQLKS